MKRRRPPLAPDAAIARVRAVYEELARRPIERACVRLTECCQFKLTGRTPFLTKGEALTAAKAWRATGGKRLPPVQDGSCPFLDQKAGRCRIYQGRPFGCRTQFCGAAGGPYARKEVIDLIHRLEDLDCELDGDGARSLPVAMAESLALIPR